ncbi:DNA polymerase epsilon subunit B isoform X2 [Prunus yedoensis var. nudiflora]|uniref:DNA polymerase epsilon subunit n=1 Tax=Prunus yedoensis var. nudiflora TaxID=2094558 RepID=A0A314U6N9_PRUYE|nr:DNA polymerase epsilon subunit B isoform X2 [Prunus yedoensis var. nudiflora]
MSSSTRKMVLKKCKIRGYTLELDAIGEILSFESEFYNDSALDNPVDILLDLLATQPIKDKETVHRIATRILGADAAINETPDGDGDDVIRTSDLLIIDASKVPKFRYDPIKKVFYKHTGSLPIHGDAFSKAALYKDRFLLLSQMLSRHKDFSKPAFDSDLSDFGRCEISPIQSLIGQTGRRWVMGLISQLEDGHFYLEDLSASHEIIIFLDNIYKITAGFFVENTIVVAEGEMLLEGVFQVFNCGFPPLEGRDKSLQFLAGHDSFGSGTLTEQEMLRLAKLEREAVNGNVVILSDIWLDNEEVMGKLERVLDAFENEDFVPCLFVLMGNFCSHPCNLGFHSFSNLRSQFGKLGQMIAAHPRLKEGSCFLFIPGPDDAGPSTVLPRPSLPKYLREELQNHIPNAIFSSNPCRMKFCGQEVVFFRQDLLYRMRRSCLMPPSTEETTDDFEHLVATITHQCHLCPLPLIVQPIIWNYDHSLYLYPTPHTIVLGDRSEQKAFKYTGITCFNPGSFSSDGAFVVYRPDNQEVELSSL